MSSFADETQEWHDHVDMKSSNGQKATLTATRAAMTSAESCPDLLDKFSRARIRNSSGNGSGVLGSDGRVGSRSSPSRNLPPPPLHQPLEKQDSAISLSADGTDPCELCGRESQDEHMCACRNEGNPGEMHEHLSPLKEQNFNNCLNKRRPSSIAAAAITQTTPIQQTTPINVNLQKWLNTSPDTKLKPRDQKILELMLARRSEQASQRDQRDMAYMQWEAERSRTHTAPPAHSSSGASKQASSSAGNSRRRQSAAPSTGVQQLRDEVKIRKSYNTDSRKSERPKTVCSNIETVPKCSCDMTAGEVCTKCNTPVRRERELQRRQYDRKLKEIERKKRQEEKKKQYEKEQEELARKIKEQQEKVLERAKSSKNIHSQEQMLRTKVRNIKTKIRQEQIKEKLQSEKEEKEYLLSQIDEKHKHAEIKRQNIKKNSELDFRRSHSDLIDRMEKSKQRKEEIDSQMISYREDLHSYLHSQEQRAADSAKNQVLQKRMRASNSNLYKTETQKKNLARLMEQEKDWKAEVEADIALKDSRIKNHKIERSEKIASSREMARTSRLLRDQMKCHYSTNDLDKHYL